MKTFGKAEKSEEFATKLAWTKRTAMEYAFKNKSSTIVAQQSKMKSSNCFYNCFFYSYFA
jgi:hypothetical protein